MSVQYDLYLDRHRENVQKAFRWIQSNLPELLIDDFDYEWQTDFAHDQSKYEPDEYEAYDAYFYGNNPSYQVVQDFKRAWLLHIHRNPHHWQHWILVNDDPEEGEVLLEIPYEYIIEMICDWWSFSWEKGNPFEIFVWYDEHKEYMRINPDSRKIIEDILGKIQERLGESSILQHHGVKGMKWGVRNGPPYPIKKLKEDTIVQDAIKSGLVSKTINPEKQMRHTKSYHIPGRSYLDGDLDFAQELVDKYSGTGEPLMTDDGQWLRKEKIQASDTIGTHVDENGNETKTNKAMIVYSKTGTHVYPRKETK